MGKKKFTSDLINIIADNIINRIRNKNIRIGRIDNKNKFIYISKIGDSTYEIKINVNNINTNVKNNKIYESGIIIK